MKILYLHGLGSSGQASTATGLAGEGLNVTAPSYQPELFSQSMQQLRAEITHAKPEMIVGTSLGGYYALKLMAETGLPTIAINPCFDPVALLSKYLQQPATNFVTGEPICFSLEMLESFQPLEKAIGLTSKALLVTGTNDTVIPANAQIAFFKEHGWPWEEVPWGHRVDDVAWLANRIRQHIQHC